VSPVHSLVIIKSWPEISKIVRLYNILSRVILIFCLIDYFVFLSNSHSHDLIPESKPPGFWMHVRFQSENLTGIDRMLSVLINSCDVIVIFTFWVAIGFLSYIYLHTKSFISCSVPWSQIAQGCLISYLHLEDVF